MHIRLSEMCGTSHPQEVDMHKRIRGYLQQAEVGDIEPKEHLSDEAKQRIKESLSKPE